MKTYFADYRNRDPVGFLRAKVEAHCVRPLQTQSAELLRTLLPADSAAFRAAKETFWKVRRAIL